MKVVLQPNRAVLPCRERKFCAAECVARGCLGMLKDLQAVGITLKHCVKWEGTNLVRSGPYCLLGRVPGVCY